MYVHGRDVLVLSTPSEYLQEPQDIHTSRSHRWELQDPKGTPGLGGIVGSGWVTVWRSLPFLKAAPCPKVAPCVGLCPLPAVSLSAGVHLQ